MKKDNKIIDDIAKLANSTFTGTVNLKNELSEYINNQLTSYLKKMNFVTREEFEVVKKLAQDNRAMLDKLKKTKSTNSRKKTEANKGKK